MKLSCALRVGSVLVGYFVVDLPGAQLVLWNALYFCMRHKQKNLLESLVLVPATYLHCTRAGLVCCLHDWQAAKRRYASPYWCKRAFWDTVRFPPAAGRKGAKFFPGSRCERRCFFGLTFSLPQLSSFPHRHHPLPSRNVARERLPSKSASFIAPRAISHSFDINFSLPRPVLIDYFLFSQFLWREKPDSQNATTAHRSRVFTAEPGLYDILAPITVSRRR